MNNFPHCRSRRRLDRKVKTLIPQRASEGNSGRDIINEGEEIRAIIHRKQSIFWCCVKKVTYIYQGCQIRITCCENIFQIQVPKLPSTASMKKIAETIKTNILQSMNYRGRFKQPFQFPILVHTLQCMLSFQCIISAIFFNDHMLDGSFFGGPTKREVNQSCQFSVPPDPSICLRLLGHENCKSKPSPNSPKTL